MERVSVVKQEEDDSKMVIKQILWFALNEKVFLSSVSLLVNRYGETRLK